MVLRSKRLIVVSNPLPDYRWLGLMFGANGTMTRTGSSFAIATGGELANAAFGAVCSINPAIDRLVSNTTESKSIS